MKREDIMRILTEALRECAAAANTDELFSLEKRYLGRGKGAITSMLRTLKTVPVEERRALGPLVQKLQRDIQHAIEGRRIALRLDTDAPHTLDVTLPGISHPRGHLHPVTQFVRRIEEFFSHLGFDLADGPEVELERNNFDLLNIPKDHPARDMHDTFYIFQPRGKSPAEGEARHGRQKSRLPNGGQAKVSGNLLLRTHTSPVQLRAMESRRPPVRILSPGRVFRHEATDASHETTFTQVEGLVIDKGIRLTDLLGTLDRFFGEIFGAKIKTRFRPHYYPFVEPGLDVDMSCFFCKGTGCSVCKKSGWLEMCGAGMVHPKVLKNMRVDPARFTGFAFGFGVDRMVMIYYGIDDVRLLHSGNLKFLEQF